MTLVQLRHLIALAEAGSFSKASHAVHLTQPALSRSIRALEDELGQPLADRVGRRIELTAYGHDVLERARRLIEDADEIGARAQRLRDGSAGALRIGMGSGPGAMLMTPLLQRTARAAPQWRVEVARGDTGSLLDRLRERQLDAVVVDVRSLQPAPDLDVTQVHEMRGAFMVRRGHPLARRRALAFDDLRAFPLASTPLSDEVARTLVERYGPQAHPSEAVSLRCDEVSSLVDVTLHSDAVLLAIRACAPALVELRLAPALDTSARFGLVTLNRRTEPTALSVVRTLMREVMRAAGPDGRILPAEPATRSKAWTRAS